MMRQRIVGPAAVVLAIVLGGCRDDGEPDAATFVAQLAAACQTIVSDLPGVEEPTSYDGITRTADHASSVYRAGVHALGQLEAPSTHRADFNALQTTMRDRLGRFAQLTGAAAARETEIVDSQISGLAQLDAASAELAVALDAGACAFPPVFTDPPVIATEAPTTSQPG